MKLSGLNFSPRKPINSTKTSWNEKGPEPHRLQTSLSLDVTWPYDWNHVPLKSLQACSSNWKCVINLFFALGVSNSDPDLKSPFRCFARNLRLEGEFVCWQQNNNCTIYYFRNYLTSSQYRLITHFRARKLKSTDSPFRVLIAIADFFLNTSCEKKKSQESCHPLWEV